jgi:cell division control protein 7
VSDIAPEVHVRLEVLQDCCLVKKMAVEKAEASSRDPFQIHEDPEEMHQQEAPRGFIKSEAPLHSEQWDSEEDETEEEEEEEEEVDESVAEDMRKLEITFKGISDRFRLINRIGEGKIF